MKIILLVLLLFISILLMGSFARSSNRATEPKRRADNTYADDVDDNTDNDYGNDLDDDDNGGLDDDKEEEEIIGDNDHDDEDVYDFDFDYVDDDEGSLVKDDKEEEEGEEEEVVEEEEIISTIDADKPNTPPSTTTSTSSATSGTSNNNNTHDNNPNSNSTASPVKQQQPEEKKEEERRLPSLALNYFDGPIADISWCGIDKETVFVLTERSSVYVTHDSGISWNQLNDEFAEEALKEADTKNEIGQVSRMIQSPADKTLYIFLGTEGINWIVSECGKIIKAINNKRLINDLTFHPTEKNWVLASSWKKCDDPTKENCKTYKELYYSDDLGFNWRLLAKYVVQFQWAFIDYGFSGNIPKARIVISHDAEQKGNQKLSGWSEKVQVSMSDDWFKTSKVIVPKGNKFLITKAFIFVVQVSDESEQDVTLLIGNAKQANYDLKPISLPNQRIREHSYTILDTTEAQVFLHINHEGSRSTYGNIYISDSTGTRYSLSLPANVRNFDGQCDFERVQGLEGIYLANVYDKEQLKKVKNQQDNEASIPQEIKSGKKSTAAPYARTSFSDGYVDMSKKLNDYKKTMITFNKGGIWSPLTPPLRDSNGKKIICEDLDSCSLHLHSISNTRYGPFYSTETSLGIVLGTGNVGSYLANREDEINTYLSRDGGLTWFEIKKGSHIYEIGDHGSLIVIAPDQISTTEVYYSWNEGLTWDTIKISDEPIEVINIITEPSYTAEKFLVYGRTRGGGSSGDNSNTLKGIIVSIDFTPVHQRWCQYPDKPGTENSDYELWTPNGKISPNCLMGHKTTYVRRKREAKCFNSEIWDRWYYFEVCQCTEEDWECDVGFIRQGGNGPCIPDSTFPITTPNLANPEAPKQCDDSYSITQGYRKVAGSICKGGIDHDYLKLPCPGSFILFGKNQWSMIIGLGIIIILVVVVSLIGWFITRNKVDTSGGSGGFIQRVKELKERMFSTRERRFRRLKNEFDREEDEDFGKIFKDGELDAATSAELVEDKMLMEMGSKKRMTSSNALDIARKNIPVLSKPKSETALMDFNPRG